MGIQSPKSQVGELGFGLSELIALHEQYIGLCNHAILFYLLIVSMLTDSAIMQHAV